MGERFDWYGQTNIATNDLRQQISNMKEVKKIVEEGTERVLRKKVGKR